MKHRIKYVIVSPRQKWGGAIALHALCKFLTELGYNARIFYTEEYEYKKGRIIKFWIKWTRYAVQDLFLSVLSHILPRWKFFENWFNLNGYRNVPIKGCKRKYFPKVDRDTIVVYPEKVYGNFLNAEKVVRWLLYFNPYKNDKKAFGSNDMIICYSQNFNDAALNPDAKQITLGYFDLDLYKQSNFGTRRGKCYIIRKGSNRMDLPSEFDGKVIDDLPEYEKVRVFNECKYCISYDLYTAYSGIAALCGCISIVVPESEEKLGKNNGNSVERIPGRAYGFSNEEISYAKRTQPEVLKRYKAINEKARDETKKFIKMCEKHFKYEHSEKETLAKE